MSENKITLGFMAELINPVGNHHTDEWTAVTEKLYDGSTNLELNYEGNIVFSRDFHKDACEFNLQVGTHGIPLEFIHRCAVAGLAIKPTTVKPYTAHWYNGADSPMSDMALGEFLKE